MRRGIGLRVGLLALVGLGLAVVATRSYVDTEPGPAGEREDAKAIGWAGDPRMGGTVFAERAGASGLVFVHDTGATGKHYFPEIMGSGCGLLDYDGDGDLDVYLVQSGPIGSRSTGSGEAGSNRLFRNELDPNDPNGTLRFTDVTEIAGVGDAGYGMGCAVGDYDNDGDPDLFVTNFGESRLYRNAGDGTFREVTTEARLRVHGWATSASFADFDNDGHLDLFIGFYVKYRLGSNWGCKTATGAPDYCGPLNYPAAQSRLYRNDGAGHFEDVTASSGLMGSERHTLGVACGDLNGDGRIDLFLANDGDGNQLWINQGGGRFVDQATVACVAYSATGQGEAGMGVAIGDADSDGDDDVFVTHLAGEKDTLYTMQRPGIFEDLTARSGLSAPSLPMTGFGTEWIDYDNDGRLDLFTTNGAVTRVLDQPQDGYPFRQLDQLFRNVGGGRFVDVSARAGEPFSKPAVGRGAAFGDIDNDGDIDIVVSYSNGPARLLLNRVGQEHPWLRIRTVGTTSNRDGIGARVILKDSRGGRRHRHVHRDGSYLSAGDVRVHFGLGGTGNADQVIVEWPTGRREIWTVAGVNVELTLTEGRGLALEM
ncbi:MAG: CRTAC1 family protein [Planctomycetota bacterium]|nr:CRTAC1 family protein [Planctomycetota bacterium]